MVERRVVDADPPGGFPLIQAAAHHPGQERLGAFGLDWGLDGSCHKTENCRRSVYESQEDLGHNVPALSTGFLLGSKPAMKASFLLRANIGSLLAARRESASALARYVGKHKTWLSK